jgi:hypothetical protein
MTRLSRSTPLALALALITILPGAAVWGQTPAPQPTEPDFALINLPTTLSLPRYKGNFRLTHRFQGNLRGQSFSQQASNLFGLDNGAAIGFEFRFALANHLQAAVYRTNIDKTVQFHGKYDAIAQTVSMPFSISALASVEGRDNFQESRAPAFGAVVSRKIGEVAALYAVPMWVHNTAGGSNGSHTSLVGLGGRLRIRPRLYLVGEVSPRFEGYKSGQTEYGFALEGRAGGHVFQLNVSNAIGTTFAQTARGGFSDTLYLGFNIARKFY